MAADGVQRPAAEPASQPEALRVRLELLREENERLRTEYARARRTAHRRAATGLGLIGGVAVLVAVLVPAQRDVLMAIGAIGLFSAVLTAYLTPERFVAAAVGELVFRQHRETLAELIDLLELSDERIYLSLPDSRRRLFVPEHPAARLPDPDDLSGPLVVPGFDRGRGLAIHPSGGGILDELADAGEPLAHAGVVDAADIVAEGLVETFEVADRISPQLDPDEGRATFAVSGAVYGRVDRLDHPIPSALACVLAVATDAPVTVEVSPGDDRADWLVSCSWERVAGDDAGAGN